MNRPPASLQILTKEIFSTVQELHSQGLTIFLVEQMVDRALEIAESAYVLARGEVVLKGTAQGIRENPAVQEAYLGRASARSGGQPGALPLNPDSHGRVIRRQADGTNA